MEKKDTAEAHNTTNADCVPDNGEDDEWDYPEEDYHEESYFADDIDDFTFDDDEEEYPPELVDASVNEEEAYISFLNSRQKMRNISNTRGSTHLWLLLHRLTTRPKPHADKGRAKAKGRRLEARATAKVRAKSKARESWTKIHTTRKLIFQPSGKSAGGVDSFGFDSSTWTDLDAFST